MSRHTVRSLRGKEGQQPYTDLKMSFTTPHGYRMVRLQLRTSLCTLVVEGQSFGEVIASVAHESTHEHP